MKFFKLPVLFFALLSFCFVDAQKIFHEHEQFEKNWSFGFGVNVVDDSGFAFDALFDSEVKRSDTWTFNTPLMVSAEYHTNSKFSFFGAISLNKWKSGKLIDRSEIVNSDPTFFGFDLGAKYSFRKLLNSKVLDPYIAQGVGYSYRGEYRNQLGNLNKSKDRITSNSAVGLNVWFSKYWGLNMNAAAKLSFADKNDYAQYALGIVHVIRNR